MNDLERQINFLSESVTYLSESVTYLSEELKYKEKYIETLRRVVVSQQDYIKFLEQEIKRK